MTDEINSGGSTADGGAEETDYIKRLQALADQGKLPGASTITPALEPAPIPVAAIAADETPPPVTAAQFSAATPAAIEVTPAPEVISAPAADPEPAPPPVPGPYSAPRPEANNGTSVMQLTALITAEIHKAVVGQDIIIEAALSGLFAEGHVLLEGVPGTAKTLLVRTLAAAIQADFGRIQFTPDLMPSDITGSRIYDMQSGEFHFKRGPIFTGLLLADEVNRTPPKTQAALLESMQEKHVTIDGELFDLPPLFMVFATQNPVEFEGTYPLPEAQLDRFMLKVLIDYPSQEDEQRILRRFHDGFDPNDLSTVDIRPVATTEQIQACRREIASVRIEESLFRYITALTAATREHRQVVLGASPRASIALLRVSKALAAMRGRDYVIPDDIKSIAPSILRHRLILRPEAEIEGTTADRVIEGILDRLEVPR